MNAIEINGLTKYYGKARGIVDLCVIVVEFGVFGFMGGIGFW